MICSPIELDIDVLSTATAPRKGPEQLSPTLHRQVLARRTSTNDAAHPEGLKIERLLVGLRRKRLVEAVRVAGIVREVSDITSETAAALRTPSV